ncbi:MAG: hypothetical protein ACREVJ_09855, partial [Gammaproteobacteria bacterium]
SALKGDGEEPTGKKSKTAVLAVPEAATARLMLAESSGKLRLALHAAQASVPPAAAPGVPPANHYVALQQLVGSPRTGSRTAPAAPPQIVVHRGDRVEIVDFAGTGALVPGLPLSLSGAAQRAPGSAP